MPPATTARKRKPDHEATQAPAVQADPPAPDQAPTASVPAPAEPPAADPVGDAAAALRRPFRADQLGWKAQAVSQDKAKCLAVPYIDARDVMDRLDEAVGIAGWRDSYSALENGNVLCRLELNLGGEWIPKEDAGGPSDQQDAGDRAKAAHSEALKRAAVKWGVGRYLYALPAFWVAYDEKKRQPAAVPSLPAWALPPAKPGTATVIAGGQHLAGPAPTAVPVAADDPRAKALATSEAARQERYGPKPAPAQQSAPPKADFLAGLQAYDATLAADGLCPAGALVTHVAQQGKKAGHPADLTLWDDAQVKAARAWTLGYARVRHQETLDDLLTAKGETVERALRALRKPPGSSIVRLTNEELWELIVRLRKVPDKGEAAA